MLRNSLNACELEIIEQDTQVIETELWSTLYERQYSVTFLNDFEEDNNNSLSDVWNNNFIMSDILSSTKIECALESLSSIVDATLNSDWTDYHHDIINSIKLAHEQYLSDCKEAHLKTFPHTSAESLKQFARFIPEFKDFLYNVYVDEVSGEFGLTLRSKPTSRTVLNLLMQENKEVVFSYVTKGAGLVKISGRAYFNNNLEDSSYIRKLLRMMK